MEADAHIGEAAELYAVGALTEEERSMVDAHAAHCAACLRRLGEAEETVLALERRFVTAPAQRPPRKVVSLPRRGVPGWLLPLAAAAAFVIGLFAAGTFPRRESPTLAMIGSHFSHAQFAGAAAPPAKVIYARDRSWYYVIVAGRHRFTVYGLRNGQGVALGTTQPAQQTSELFVRPRARFDRLELRERNAVIATATTR